MRYKELITRRIGFLTERKHNEMMKLGRYRVSFFSDIKRKEIIVWMWLQENKDKDQIKEFIQDKFHVSDPDAEKLYYEAYPDGLDCQEEEMVNNLDKVLTRVVNLKPTMLGEAIDALAGGVTNPPLEQFSIDPSVQNQIKLVIGTLLKRRNII